MLFRSQFHAGVATGLGLWRPVRAKVWRGRGAGAIARAGDAVTDPGASTRSRPQPNTHHTSTALPSRSAHASRGWVAAHAPPTPTYAHAGVLLGLGLGGHLRCLAAPDLYRTLSSGHEPTILGLLLGLAASHLGTRDAPTSHVLMLHLCGGGAAGPALSGPPTDGLEIGMQVQSAALVGLGLLHAGACHRPTIDRALAQLDRASSGAIDPGKIGGGSADAAATRRDAGHAAVGCPAEVQRGWCLSRNGASSQSAWVHACGPRR